MVDVAPSNCLTHRVASKTSRSRVTNQSATHTRASSWEIYAEIPGLAKSRTSLCNGGHLMSTCGGRGKKNAQHPSHGRRRPRSADSLNDFYSGHLAQVLLLYLCRWKEKKKKYHEGTEPGARPVVSLPPSALPLWQQHKINNIKNSIASPSAECMQRSSTLLPHFSSSSQTKRFNRQWLIREEQGRMPLSFLIELCRWIMTLLLYHCWH